MKLAIIGSRCLADNVTAQRIVANHLTDPPAYGYPEDVSLLISGGAIGVDSIAESFALKAGIPTEIHRPRVERWNGPGGYRERNEAIAHRCDRLLCIECDRSRTHGANWTYRCAQRLGKPVAKIVITSCRRHGGIPTIG